MKKIILSLVLLIIVAIAASVFYVFSNLDELIKEAIETYGSQATQTSVRVDSVKMKLTEGSGGISGLTIANPKGFESPYAFSLGETRLAIDLQSLQEEPYIINEITVLAPEIFVEVNKDNVTNLIELKKNLMASLPASSEAVETTPTDTSAMPEPRIIVRKIKFADGRINAKVAALKNKVFKLKLPKVELTNLGGDKGLTPTELISEILSQLSEQASKAVKKNIIDAELEKLKAEMKAKLNAKKAEIKAKIDKEKAKLKTLKADKKQELRDKAKDKLKHLFGR